MGLLLNEVSTLLKKDTEKAEFLNSLLVFTARTCPQESQALEIRERVWREEYFPLVRKGLVRDHLGMLDTNIPMDEMRCTISAEGAGRSDWWTTLHHRRKEMESGTWRLEESQCHPSLQGEQEGGGRKLQTSQLISILRKVMVWYILDAIKCRVLHLRRKNRTCHYKLGADLICWKGALWRRT